MNLLLPKWTNRSIYCQRVIPSFPYPGQAKSRHPLCHHFCKNQEFLNRIYKRIQIFGIINNNRWMNLYLLICVNYSQKFLFIPSLLRYSNLLLFFVLLSGKNSTKKIKTKNYKRKLLGICDKNWWILQC